jgi:hypothetical protein
MIQRVLMLLALSGSVLAQSDAEIQRLEALDAQCLQARSEKLKVVQQAKIDACVQTGELGSKAACERYWSDYGWGAVTKSGGRNPNLFADVPECIAAFEAWEKRGR